MVVYNAELTLAELLSVNTGLKSASKFDLHLAVWLSVRGAEPCLMVVMSRAYCNA